MAEDVSTEQRHPEIDGLLSRALQDESLERLGESLETAQRLLEVGNHAYCRDLIGYLLNRHGELDDDGLLQAIHDALETLVEDNAPAKRRASPSVGQRAEVPKPLPGEARRSRGVSMGHSLSGPPKDPRMLVGGEGGGVFAGSAALPQKAEAEQKPGESTQDDTPPSFPAVAPRRPPAVTAEEPQLGAAGTPPLAASEPWPSAPAPPPAELPQPGSLGSGYPEGGFRAGPPGGPQPVHTLVHYEASPLAHRPARPLMPVGSEARPGRLAFAFVAGCLVGALGVVVLMQQLLPEIWMDSSGAATVRSVRPERPWVRQLSVTPPPEGSLSPRARVDRRAPFPRAEPVASAPARWAAGEEAAVVSKALPVATGSAAGRSGVAPAQAGPRPVDPAPNWAPAIASSAAPLPRPAAAPPRPEVKKTAPPRQARPRPVVAAVKAKRRAPVRRRPAAPRRQLPATPAAQTAPHGTLLVQSASGGKTGVEVFVDGKLSGKLPLQLRLSPGLHEVKTVERGGYPEIRVVRVEEGQTARILVAPRAAGP